ncbi:UEV domain-containing protein [Umbelopsis sp. PMI_123]|nr:UEV domain-containing protein [Umbelopsis sp. PMI_123]
MDVRNYLHTSLQQYRDPQRTFRDVDTALQMYGSLKPKMDTYTYDHGDTQLLLCLYGTTPITYRASPYNIPVAIWIPIEYPMSPPIFYVRPTSNMLVRPGINVDVSGFCYHSYLSTWKEDVVNHNLAELIAIFQQVFGKEPPVYTKPPSNSTPSPNSTPPITNARMPSTNSPISNKIPSPPSHSYPSPTKTGDGTAFYNLSQVFSNLGLSQNAYQNSASPPTRASPGQPIVAQAPSAGDLTPLQQQVYRKLVDRMKDFKINVSVEMDRLLEANRQLNIGENQIAYEHQVLMDVKQRLQNNIEVVKQKNKDLEKTVEELNDIPDIEVDESLCGTTVVYNQLFDLVAEDNAIVDTIYYLSRALNSEVIDLATFMKLTRALSKEQFMKRALVQKIRESVGFTV